MHWIRRKNTNTPQPHINEPLFVQPRPSKIDELKFSPLWVPQEIGGIGIGLHGSECEEFVETESEEHACNLSRRGTKPESFFGKKERTSFLSSWSHPRSAALPTLIPSIHSMTRIESVEPDHTQGTLNDALGLVDVDIVGLTLNLGSSKKRLKRRRCCASARYEVSSTSS